VRIFSRREARRIVFTRRVTAQRDTRATTLRANTHKSAYATEPCVFPDVHTPRALRDAPAVSVSDPEMHSVSISASRDTAFRNVRLRFATLLLLSRPLTAATAKSGTAK